MEFECTWICVQFQQSFMGIQTDGVVIFASNTHL